MTNLNVSAAAFLLFAAVAAVAEPLDELVPVPRQVVRLPGEASPSPVCVRRAAVPGAPAATADEAYVLEVTPTGAVITASSVRGERWAHVTLEQLTRLSSGPLPCCRIVDWPQFRWRGFMHDSGRNFLELADVKGLIDVMSRAKLNLFHWHLTEYYGWRLESKRHPELQRPEAFFRRYVGRYYTQDEFREVLAYAAAHGVTVMPEFEMPGHALAFRRAFGFSEMREPGVREKLCDLVDELCTLAPKELMPFVHIGSDEADRPEEKVPAGWLAPIVDRVRAAGRTAVGWVPGELNGLPDKTRLVGMRWGDSADAEKIGRIPCLDACGMYVDTLDPFEFLGVATYRRICPWKPADGERLGAIMCAWHDDFAGEGRLTIRNQALLPALLLFGDAYWCGRDDCAPGTCARVLPRGSDPALRKAAAFERRMIAQRDKVHFDSPYPFQFLGQTALRWRVTHPDGSLVATDVTGATLSFWQFWTQNDGNLLEERSGTIVAETWIRSPDDREVGAWIGFTDYNRNHGRACSGPTPAIGQWNRHGATVAVNGEKVEPPRWRRPGQVRGAVVKEILGVHELDEVPFEDEEYYMREPTRIRLYRGWNHVRLTVPMTDRTGFYAPWTATFALLAGTTERPREIPDLEYACEPPTDDPRFLTGDAVTAYRDPAALWHDGTFHVFFTLVETEADRSIHSYVAHVESPDLKTWTKPVKITPKSVMDYSSPGNVVRDGDDWVICYQSYPRPGNVDDGRIRYGNDTARLFTARSKDLRTWSEPELIRVKGPDVAEKDMGRMIDPFLLRDEAGSWRCFYKQAGGPDGREGACFSKSADLRTWQYVGRTEAGENVCVVRTDGGYLMMHSPATGMGLKTSADLVHWRDVPGLVTLNQDTWPWARGRLTAGCLLDARDVPGCGKWLLFFHGSGPKDECGGAFDRNAHLAVVPFDLDEYTKKEK